jgi:hypothetical protein
MALRWSVTDDLSKLENEFRKEALLVIAALKPPDVDPAVQKRLVRILELCDILTLEWQKSYPVVNGKEQKHLSIESVMSNPIRN